MKANTRATSNTGTVSLDGQLVVCTEATISKTTRQATGRCIGLMVARIKGSGLMVFKMEQEFLHLLMERQKQEYLKTMFLLTF